MVPHQPTKRYQKLPEEVLALLQDMGLSEKQIEMYDYLLQSGGDVPSTVARETGQPRGRIYEELRELVQKGFARERPSKPIVFWATPLSEVLGAVKTRLDRHLKIVHRAQADDATTLRPEAESEPRPDMGTRDVAVFSGRRACHAEITRMAEAAKDLFWLSGGGHFPERLANMPNLLEDIQVAAARGVDVRIIMPRRKVMHRALALIDVDRAEPLIRQIPSDDTGPLVSCVTESASLELVAQPDDEAPSRGEDVGVQIRDAVFAARLKQRLMRLMPDGSSEQTPSAFPWLGPDHGSDIFADAINRSTTDVQVLGPPEWGTYMQEHWDKDAPAYAAAVKRGVRLRAVATHDAASERQLTTFQKSWRIRLVDALPMWLTIVDGRELYQAFPHASLGGVPQFRRSVEPHEIRFYQGLFDRLWDGATVRPGEASEDSRDRTTDPSARPLATERDVAQSDATRR